MRLRKMKTLGRFSQGKAVQIWPCDQDTRCSFLKKKKKASEVRVLHINDYRFSTKPPEVISSATMSRRAQRHFRWAQVTEFVSLSILVRRLTCSNGNSACSHHLKTIMDTVLLCLVTWSSKEKCRALGKWGFSKKFTYSILNASVNLIGLLRDFYLFCTREANGRTRFLFLNRYFSWLLSWSHWPLF